MNANLPSSDERGALARLGSVCRTCVFYLWSGPHVLAVICAALARRESDLCYRLTRSWARIGLGIFGVRVEARGVDKLRRGEDYVVLANHRSNFDVLAIIHAFGEHETRWVAKRELLKVPVFGLGLRVTGQIVIDREDHEQAIGELRKNLGKRGASVVFFPEGRRAETTELLPFKKGGAAFALDAGLRIVPVAVSGSERLLPVRSLTPRSGTIRVTVGDPIDVAGMTGADRDTLTARVRDVLEDMLAELETRPPCGAVPAPPPTATGEEPAGA